MANKNVIFPSYSTPVTSEAYGGIYFVHIKHIKIPWFKKATENEGRFWQAQGFKNSYL
jgi:hypothetical protein